MTVAAPSTSASPSSEDLPGKSLAQCGSCSCESEVARRTRDDRNQTRQMSNNTDGVEKYLHGEIEAFSNGNIVGISNKRDVCETVAVQHGVLTKSTMSRTGENMLKGSGCEPKHIDYLLFDLDGTLYNGEAHRRLNAHTRKQILNYMVETHGTGTTSKFNSINTEQDAYEAWRPLITQYNQTVRGLLLGGYDIPDIRQCNYAIRRGSEQFLQHNALLRQVLLSLPSRVTKCVFTNAPEDTTWTYLERMGIDDCFDCVYGMYFMGVTECCKPEIAVNKL